MDVPQVICHLSNWFHCNFQIFATKDLFRLLLDIYFDNSTASFSLDYGKVPQFTFSKIGFFPLFNLWRILRPTNSHTPLFNVYYMLGHCTARENKQKISQYLFGSMYTTLKKEWNTKNIKAMDSGQFVFLCFTVLLSLCNSMPQQYVILHQSIANSCQFIVS